MNANAIRLKCALFTSQIMILRRHIHIALYGSFSHLYYFGCHINVSGSVHQITNHSLHPRFLCMSPQQNKKFCTKRHTQRGSKGVYPFVAAFLCFGLFRQKQNDVAVDEPIQALNNVIETPVIPQFSEIIGTFVQQYLCQYARIVTPNKTFKHCMRTSATSSKAITRCDDEKSLQVNDSLYLQKRNAMIIRVSTTQNCFGATH